MAVPSERRPFAVLISLSVLDRLATRRSDVIASSMPVLVLSTRPLRRPVDEGTIVTRRAAEERAKEADRRAPERRRQRSLIEVRNDHAGGRAAALSRRTGIRSRRPKGGAAEPASAAPEGPRLWPPPTRAGERVRKRRGPA